MPLPTLTPSSGHGINFLMTSVGWDRKRQREADQDLQEYVGRRRILQPLALERFRRAFFMRGLFDQGLEDWGLWKDNVISLIYFYSTRGTGI